MSIQFLDRTIQSIDDMVIAKERTTHADAHRIEEERDAVWKSAFLARDIAARAPEGKTLRTGGFSGWRGEGESFHSNGAWQRTEGKRTSEGVVLTYLYDLVLCNGAIEVREQGYKGTPKSFLEEFYRGKHLEISDDLEITTTMLLPIKQIIITGKIGESVRETMRGSGQGEKNKQREEYLALMRNMSPEHEACVRRLFEFYTRTEGMRIKEVRIEDKDAARRVIEYYQREQQGLILPDEGVVIGQIEEGKPIRLYPDGNVYVQCSVLQDASVNWKRKIVVVSAQEYPKVIAEDKRIRRIAFKAPQKRAREGDIKEQKDRPEDEPKLLQYVSSTAYHRLRQYFMPNLEQEGIVPADQRKLWVNNGFPMNRYTLESVSRVA